MANEVQEFVEECKQVNKQKRKEVEKQLVKQKGTQHTRWRYKCNLTESFCNFALPNGLCGEPTIALEFDCANRPSEIRKREKFVFR